jgi:lipooligosaccharide transport system ATP-binding protein
MAHSPILEVQSLKKHYPKVQAVDGVSFGIREGICFGLLGPNGAGKTSTMKMMYCASPVSAGELHILGLDVRTHARDIKHRIGVVPQEDGLDPDFTVFENLILYASYHNIPRATVEGRARELLRFMQIDEKLASPVDQLSGGMKRRLAIARGMINEPELLFLDEPTTGLDPQARLLIWDNLRDLKKRGMSMVLTTHYMEEAEFLCNRVAIMDSGKILKMEEPAKLIEDLSHTTEISFFSKEPLQNESFKGLENIAKIYNDFPKISMEISSLDHISTIINFLKTNNIIFSGFTVRTASLEDVYLRLTGHAFEE